MSIKQLCDCGCDVDTHFEDEEYTIDSQGHREIRKFRGACLGLHCNECSVFRPPGVPDPKYGKKDPKRSTRKFTRKPHLDTSCRCAACKQWLSET